MLKRMNKKGYIRMIEAVIAIVIVFGFVLTVLPKKMQDTGAIPSELDSTLKAILEESQNNEQFRTCLLLNNDVMLVNDPRNDRGNKKNFNCLSEEIANSLPQLSNWQYAFAICKTNSVTGCAVYSQLDGYTEETQSNIVEFSETGLPKDKDVYTKSTVIAKPDVIAKPYLVKGGNCCAGVDFRSLIGGACELNKVLERNPENCISTSGKMIVLYLWSSN